MVDKSGNTYVSSSRGHGRKHRLSVAVPSSSSTIPPASFTIPVPPFLSPPHTITVVCSSGAMFSPSLYSGPPIHAPTPIMYNILPSTYATKGIIGFSYYTGSLGGKHVSCLILI